MVRLISLLLLLACSSIPAHGQWQVLAPGMELGTFTSSGQGVADTAPITILRIDPAQWDMELLSTTKTGDAKGKTARGWCEEHGLTAAINAGMYGTDYKTHVGYLRAGRHVNNSHVNSYQSVAAFAPHPGTELPPFRIFDLDESGASMQQIRRDYSSLMQNLRLIKRPGENRWSPQEKRWSEAALGEDGQGRMLFLFSPRRLSMHDFNERVLSLGIGLVAAQHLEGGSQAQLFVRAGAVERELFGGYDSYFLDEEGDAEPWPIPIVLGVRPKQAAGD